MRIAITGATGLIGRNLLFEIIKQNLRKLDTLEIFIMGRSKDSMDIKKRIKKIICEDGLEYLSLSKKEEDKIINYCDFSIRGISIDLDKEKLGLKADDFGVLNKSPIDIFFHNAALTDLRSTPAIEKALRRTNVFGTQQILQLIAAFKRIGEFCYVGTAYSCGDVEGDVQPDFSDFNQKFRNPYEKTKLEGEMAVRKFSKERKIRCRYFRPSITCGRLMEKPLGAISKFDVFYGWAAFFLQMKLRATNDFKNRYAKPAILDVRMCYDSRAGVNIVPVDYAAKVMYQVCIQNAPGESYHLVNNQQTPHNYHIPAMLKSINVTGVRHVDNIPKDMNSLERLYYKTAGKVFTPYTTTKRMLFNVNNIANILKRANLSCPPVDEKTFPSLMEYAKQHDFGLALQNKYKVYYEA